MWRSIRIHNCMTLIPSGRARIKLNPLERDEVGDVKGKTLLHLQCHFGMDTLSVGAPGGAGDRHGFL